jgi:uncharacterized protein (DUF885 family)
MECHSMMDSHTQLANRYFGHLAECFPVMSASDEFHFLPRSQEAINYYDRMESLSASSIDDCISVLKTFQREFRRRANREEDSEKQIDLKLMEANATGVLLELEKHQTWRHNPLLYLKIAFIGLDHAITKPADSPQERRERTHARLSAIPRLLQQGMDNIDGVPETYYQAAGAMLKDCQNYLREVEESPPDVRESRFDSYVQEVRSALDVFGRYLQNVRPVPDRKFAGSSIEESLNKHFLSVRQLDDVFQIAVEEWHHMLFLLEKLGSEIDPNETWQSLYHSYLPKELDDLNTISFYREEIDRMCRFFSNIDLCENTLCHTMELTDTPLYLRSVRSGASFAASLTADEKEKSLFYLTTHMPGREAERLLRKRFHREYIFLIAHETIPGHHMLDSVRRKLENPVRRQVESALFYEGWASYAEWLLFEYGYVNGPMEYLVHYKRRLWRSARCQIDAGLPKGLLTRDDAVSLLTTSGFSQKEAIRQIDRFSLNPGYQLCYYLGSHEFLKLKETYGNQMDSNTFYKLVLSSGQIPFHLIAQKLENAGSKGETLD